MSVGTIDDVLGLIQRDRIRLNLMGTQLRNYMDKIQSYQSQQADNSFTKTRTVLRQPADHDYQGKREGDKQ